VPIWQSATMAYRLMEPRFPLGSIVATPAAIGLGVDLNNFIHRHHCGHWGDLDSEDKETNEQALKVGARILSCYQVGGGRRIYIITEADRSVTTVLLAEEY
jgi:hypothetical protein